MKNMIRGLICLAIAAGVSFAASSATTIKVGSAETYTTITDAMAYVETLGDGDYPVEIVIEPGTYTENGFTLDKAITIRGATGNPADVKILDGGETFTDDVNKGGTRAFTLTHADAAVRDLTVYGKGYQKDGGQGGHVWMSNGRVENCVLRDGCAGGRANVTKNSHGQGGNVWLSGGRLVRCQILSGLANGYKGNSGGDKGKCESYGAGIYATGGVIENCLVRGNLAYLDRGVNSPMYVSGGGLYADGPVTVVNCTFADNVPGQFDASVGGIQLSSKATAAKVVNCFFINNGGTAVREFGNANLTCFSHCASTVLNAEGDTWQVISSNDFVGNGDYHLQQTSTLVDGGTQDSGWYPEGLSTFDLDGLARVSGKAIDVGCYEVDQSSVTCGGYPSTYGAFEGSVVTFTAQGVGGSGEYVFNWDFGDGTISGASGSVCTYAYQTSGLFTMRVAVSDDNGVNWSDWFTVATKIVVTPKEMFVNASATNPTFPYRTPETGALTLGEALEALTNDVSEGFAYTDGAIVRVCPGTYTETGFRLCHGIRVIGQTGNPADVEIVDNVEKSRAFTIEHADAVVSGLTVSGRGWHWNGCEGGHVYMTAGTVENCILTDGCAGAHHGEQSAELYGRGGNVWMSGGRLVRCQVLSGKANEYNGANVASFGAGIYASGGVVENCLVRGNSAYDASTSQPANVFGGGLYADGPVTVANCTFVDNVAGKPATSAGGIQLGSAEAKVVNCVFFNNGGTAVCEFGNANLTCFSHCASSVANEACETWQVIDETAFKNWAGRDSDLDVLTPQLDKPLLNTGTDAAGYWQSGAVSSVDLLGRNRFVKRHVDIGCLESQGGNGLIVIVK